MAIDTTMFAVNLPAGTYTAGDQISMKNIRGPSVVRDGYGGAFLKRIFVSTTNAAAGATIRGHVVIKNSNWDDSAANLAIPPLAISLGDNSSNVQKGHDAPLIPNSGWEAKFVIDDTVTTTAANDAVALIDIDYPSVQAVQNPRESKGYPVTNMRYDPVTIAAYGSSETAPWTTVNVDILKAGYKYLLTEMGAFVLNSSMGFISISGAAGQNGLERIIPSVSGNLGNLRYFLDYSTPLVKGPMNLNYMFIGTAGTATTITEIDWVKKR